VIANVEYDEVPNKLPVIPPEIVSGPLTNTEPVNLWVSSTELPKKVEPLLNDCVMYNTDEETMYCSAVSVPRIVRPEKVGESDEERPSWAEDDTTPDGKDDDTFVICDPSPLK